MSQAGPLHGASRLPSHAEVHTAPWPPGTNSGGVLFAQGGMMMGDAIADERRGMYAQRDNVVVVENNNRGFEGGGGFGEHRRL